MKILCVIDSLGSGGAQRQLVNLALGFKEKGQDVSFLVYHNINFFKEILDKNDILVHEIIESNYLKRLFKMRKYIREGRFDSVLSFLEAPNFITTISGFPTRRWKLVVGERSADPAILKSLKLRAYRWFHSFADYVVANSHENLKMVYNLNPLLPVTKGKVIYNMVDFEIWKPNEIFVHRKNNIFLIVIAASHRHLKNLSGLVEAVNLLTSEEKKHLKIHWYGDNKHDDSKNIAQEKIDRYNLNNVFSFFKPTLNIQQKVKEADAVALFSFFEGMPNTICEGMASEKPVISSNVSDIAYLVSNVNLICDPNIPISISNSLKYILKMTAEDLKQESLVNRKKAEEIFYKKNIVDHYLKLLTKSNIVE
jgi:glycosyltransferase involved in cell wall biosynthesis